MHCIQVCPTLFPQYCLGVSVFKYMFSPDRLNKGCLSYFDLGHFQMSLLKCSAHQKSNRN